MVDTTSMRPRSSFGTFLPSDISYYDYQRLLRSKKVALLQDKKRRSSEPGYKKPDSIVHASGSLSQVIFLKSQDATRPSLKSLQDDRNLQVQVDETVSEVNDNPHSHQIPRLVDPKDCSVRQDENCDGVQTQSERLPRIKAKARLVKSATTRDPKHSSPSHAKVLTLERPKTVGGVRDQVHGIGLSSQGVQTDPLIGTPQESWPSVSHKQSLTENPAGVVDLEEPGQNEIDVLAQTYTWRTSSQRATDEVGWKERIPSTSAPRPASTVEQFPDPVSMRLTFRRYHSEPAEWQCVGAEWDSAQSRPGSSSFTKGPQGILYSSSSRKIQQLPGYYGHVPNSRSVDTPTSNCQPTTLVRSSTPRTTSTSRQANIPGYTGCVRWSSVSPAHSNMSLPELTTSARTHRHFPLEEERSPFVRTGLFSKMIKTVSPYNPYNKID